MQPLPPLPAGEMPPCPFSASRSSPPVLPPPCTIPPSARYPAHTLCMSPPSVAPTAPACACPRLPALLRLPAIVPRTLAMASQPCLPAVTDKVLLSEVVGEPAPGAGGGSSAQPCLVLWCCPLIIWKEAHLVVQVLRPPGRASSMSPQGGCIISILELLPTLSQCCSPATALAGRPSGARHPDSNQLRWAVPACALVAPSSALCLTAAWLVGEGSFVTRAAFMPCISTLSNCLPAQPAVPAWRQAG